MGDDMENIQRNQTTILNPFKSLNKEKVSSADKIILKSVAIEFEVRKSNLIDYYA